MRVVVTGAAGFIGSHLAEALRARGDDVLGLDRIPAPGVTECDLVTDDLGALADADVILHLAGRAGVRGRWEPAHRDNVLATERLLAAVAARRPRFVLASSSSVYGDAGRPCREDDALDPRSAYAQSKVVAEGLTRRAAGSGLPAVILRYFSVYGPRQRPDMAFHRFIEAALHGSPAPLYGDGDQRRSFTYVADVVAATVEAATRPLPPGTVLNVGSPVTSGIRDAMARIGALLGTPPPTVPKDAVAGDVARTWADTGRAEQLLGWTATTGLDDGLARQIDWQRSNRG